MDINNFVTISPAVQRFKVRGAAPFRGLRAGQAACGGAAQTDLGDNVEQAKTPKRLPVVLTQTEVHQVLWRMDGTPWLMASLLYWAGRIMECARLRVKGRGVRSSGNSSPRRQGRQGPGDAAGPLAQPLKKHLVRVKALHEEDLAEGHGDVYLPYALEKEYPNAAREWPGNTSFPPRTVRATHVPGAER